MIATDHLTSVKRISDPSPSSGKRISREEFAKVLPLLESRTRNIILFLINTGARVGEALALKPSNIDWKSGVININTTKRATQGKKAIMRKTPLNKTLREILKSGIDFPCRSTIQVNWKKALQKAGVKHYRLHDLRHTFGSEMADSKKVPPFILKEIMGHSNIATTLLYYHAGGMDTSKMTEVMDSYWTRNNL